MILITDEKDVAGVYAKTILVRRIMYRIYAQGGNMCKGQDTIC